MAYPSTQVRLQRTMRGRSWESVIRKHDLSSSFILKASCRYSRTTSHSTEKNPYPINHTPPSSLLSDLLSAPFTAYLLEPAPHADLESRLVTCQTHVLPHTAVGKDYWRDHSILERYDRWLPRLDSNYLTVEHGVCQSRGCRHYRVWSLGAGVCSSSKASLFLGGASRRGRSLDLGRLWRLWTLCDYRRLS